MLRFLTAGESHGPALTVIVDGVPAGLSLAGKTIADELARRRLGFGRGPRMKIERDELEILGGVRFGKTIGSPIALIIRNSEWAKWERVMSPEGAPSGNVRTEPRPGHADLSGMLKYGLSDARDVLERASARETAARTAAGAIAKVILAEIGIRIVSHVTAIGSAASSSEARPRPEDLERVDASQVRSFDERAADAMVAEIEAAGKAGDSLGGVFEVIAYDVLPGLGSHVQWDRKLDGVLAQAIVSIPGVKGVEVGDAWNSARQRGSQAHDEIFHDSSGYRRETDRAGGTEGGMTVGGTLWVRAAMKPLSTLKKPLRTVDVATKEPAIAFRERTDVCSVPAAAVVGEAMVALVLAAAVIEKFAADSMQDLAASVDAYRRRISSA